MNQIIQSLRDGSTEVADVPAPEVGRGQLLIHSSQTLISAGTERMLIEFGQANLFQKALQQPERVRMVLEKVKTDGLLPAIASVRSKLDQPLPLGYCNVGIVAEVGSDVSGFVLGDRVASNGQHAEVVRVPSNLCARVPDGVPDDHAAFTVLGAIALQGIRLAQPSLGEAVVVTGLGLIGLMTVQLLRAQGCRVLGIDYDAKRLSLARTFGAETVDLSVGEDPRVAATTFSRGRGVDAVIVTASTDSNEPLHQAAVMCRQRGRIILVGVAGLNLSRDDFYKKELTFQVSCSYGPGRYDPAYEDMGQDYPVGFVRWTEQRNFEAVLDMMADERLDVGALISHRFPITEADRAYALVSGSEPSLGVLLEYPRSPSRKDARVVRLASTPLPAHGPSRVTVSFVGSGNHATAVLIPAFKKAGVRLRTVASSGGISGFYAARKFGFEETTTDTQSVFSDGRTQAAIITTRHDSHARLVVAALEAGKHVFVEKPLCITLAELSEIEDLCVRLAAGGGVHRLMVGFNRRFAPQVVKIKRLLMAAPGPKAVVMTVNAGAIPADHWTQNRDIGGGRVIGEGCHFVDLLRFIVGVPITSHSLTWMKAPTTDTTTIQLSFADGSIGTIHYFANGNKGFPKERLEVFASGGVLQLDNFRKLTGYSWPGFTSMNLWRQDKGQSACVAAFVQALQAGAPSPIPLDEVLEVSRVSIELGS